MIRSIRLHRFASLTSVALLVSSLPLASETAVPDLMSYQGYVTDTSNVALANATPANYEVTFRIYDRAQAGNIIWAEEQTVTIFKGNFSVLLGQGREVTGAPNPNLNTVFTDKDRYMGITVGSNAEFTPRQRILTSAYAYRAKVAESVDGVISADGGLTLGGTAVTASAAELNYLDIAHKGAVAANKGVVVDEHKDAKGFRNLQASYLDAVTLLARQNLVVNGNADLNGSLDVDGHTHLDGFTSDGLATINSNLHVRHSINLDDRLNVDGNSLFKGHVDIRNNLYTGVDGNGVTARIYGNTAGSYLTWNPVHNELQLIGTAKMFINNVLRVEGATDFNAKMNVHEIDVETYSYFTGISNRDYTHLGGNVNVVGDATFRGTVLVRGVSVGSDKRLKKNIKNIDGGALDKLLQLRPVTFEYKDPETAFYSEGTQTGFIAQEVEEVFPDWVVEKSADPGPGPEPKGPLYKCLSMYSGFQAVTVQALRELRAEKDVQIDALKQANSALETRLARLEALLEKQGSGLKPVSGSIKESN